MYFIKCTTKCKRIFNCLKLQLIEKVFFAAQNIDRFETKMYYVCKPEVC